MSTKGRKPKPTAIKVLEGNPGKRKLNKNEIVPEKGKLPKCPDWLEDEAKAEWDRLCKNLFELGILTELDLMPFASYCQAYARWREAEEFISQHGTIVKTKSGYWQQVPQVSISHQNQKIMMQAASEFGLTPSARSRIIAGNAREAEIDEMEFILMGGA
ncbi:phage terminase small subunit P27 family [Butyrivibrio sp. MB2005]|uniref:phage terminase small subunit P27 family n=1 Tax=Butyrivibrio sp. MB2005 TaxID=1280678 RepID=UPI0003FEBDCD|nr:phage terminase small subunit P27 family [Butyrivibrio sp. MB2005]